MRILSFLLQKEFRQIFRDRQIVAMILVLPIMQLVLLANAATFEVKQARFALVDHDRTPSSRLLVDRFTASGHFELAGSAASLVAGTHALQRGDVRMVLEIPRDFSADLERRRQASLLLVFDAVDGATAGVLNSYAATIVRRFEQEVGASLRTRTMPEAPRVGAGGQIAYWFNPELSYPDYMVPGILVELVTMVGLLLSALNIVREKELGTLEQLNVTPMTKGQFIAGKLIPFWLLGLVALSVGLLVAKLLFDIPMHGSLALVFAIAGLYLLVMLGIGLAISTASETQQQATFLAIFVLLVLILLSGLFTPAESMPLWAQRLALANPLYHYVAVMRKVLLLGSGFAGVRDHVAWLALFAAIVLPAATLRYQKVSS